MQKERTGSVGTRIRAEVHISTLQLLGVSITTHRDHALPQLLRVLVDKVRQTRVNVTGRDGVDTGKVAPFVCQRARHMDAASFGDVVRGLFLREVGNVARHGGRDDEGAGAAFLEVGADGLCAVECAIEIGLHNLVP